MKAVTRRQFLRATTATGLLSLLPGISFAQASGENRLVVVLLRGALDGLHAVPPLGDRDYRDVRGTLATDELLAKALRLNDLFALHPALENLHALYVQRELTVFHAIATSYRERSHFDAQDLLENGTDAAHGARDGWLNRALLEFRKPPASGTAYAFGQNVPLILRGAAPVNTWAPSRLPEVDADLLARLSRLYADDDLLARRLQESLSAEAMANGEDMGAIKQAAGPANQKAFGLIMEAAAKFLAAEDGPRIAVIDSNGWDTHANEEAVLAGRLRGLDAAIDALHRGLGNAWSKTAVLVVTEFGRTIAVNGSRGTDHGTATAAFLCGGAVAGGRVVADWPGLAMTARLEGRDLQPTIDLRSVCKGLLRECFDVGDAALNTRIFPDSGAASPLKGLLRA